MEARREDILQKKMSYKRHVILFRILGLDPENHYLAFLESPWHLGQGGPQTWLMEGVEEGWL